MELYSFNRRFLQDIYNFDVLTVLSLQLNKQFKESHYNWVSDKLKWQFNMTIKQIDTWVKTLNNYIN